MAANEEEETTVSLVDVLEEDEELENEASAVLAGSDSDLCSFPQGYVKRQALYACNTCTPKGGEAAGVCLACSYKCHEGHDLFELYTKRNFRCDCGNSKFKQQCKLYPDKEQLNSENKYSHNFFGLYCTCNRPYPDPDDQVEDEMVQCILCEDWLHGRHLGCETPDSVELQEMVCGSCMNKNPFLWTYAATVASNQSPITHSFTELDIMTISYLTYYKSDHTLFNMQSSVLNEGATTPDFDPPVSAVYRKSSLSKKLQLALPAP